MYPYALRPQYRHCYYTGERQQSEIECETEYERSAEAGDDLKYGFRRRVLDALAAYGQAVKRDSYRSRNLRLWGDRLEMIYTHLFWDLDCLDEKVFGDLDPRRAEALKDELGIDPDYFSTPPPLVREEDFLEADDYIRRVGGYGRRR